MGWSRLRDLKKKKGVIKEWGQGLQMPRSEAQKALCLGWTADAPCPHLFLTICSRVEGQGERARAFVTSVP